MSPSPPAQGQLQLSIMSAAKDIPERLQGGATHSGFHAFLGIPLVMVGILMLARVWRYIPSNLEATPGDLVQFFLGWALVVGGLLAAFGGEVWFVDARSRSFERSWIFFGYPMRRRVVDFQQILGVEFARQSSDDDGHESFTVDLRLERQKSFRIGTRVSVTEALILSSQLSQIVSKPWQDSTSGSLRFRPPHRVLQNLRQYEAMDRKRPWQGEVPGEEVLDSQPLLRIEVPSSMQPGERTESTEFVVGDGLLAASGPLVVGEELVIGYDQLLSVEAGDRLAVLGHYHFLECGFGLPKAELRSIRDRIVQKILEQG